jgi:hypothetical protein
VANPQNLKPWKKGQSGNPAGYSKGRRFMDELHRLFDDKQLDAAFIQVGVREALRGDFRFWSYLYDRVEGKVVNTAPPVDTDERPPRIVIPGLPRPSGRRATPRRARKR